MCLYLVPFPLFSKWGFLDLKDLCGQGSFILYFLEGWIPGSYVDPTEFPHSMITFLPLVVFVYPPYALKPISGPLWLFRPQDHSQSPLGHFPGPVWPAPTTSAATLASPLSGPLKPLIPMVEPHHILSGIFVSSLDLRIPQEWHSQHPHQSWQPPSSGNCPFLCDL